MNQSNLTKISSTMEQSVIRKYTKNSAKSLYDQYKSQIKEIDEIIETTVANSKDTLKVVILGEVKAGKSTLINALLQNKVAFTNVTEATTVVSEITHSSSNKTTLIKKDGSRTEFNTLSELHTYMEESMNNLDKLNDVVKIEIKKNIDRLKSITVVDTPGLNTITASNAARTNDYIANADIILWVMNCHHLGQSDVTDSIERVSEFGKPIICVLNRIDELTSSTPARLIEYVDDEIGYLFEKIIAVSGQKAWNGYINNDPQLITESNINQLYDYICSNIANQADKVHEDSIQKTIDASTARDISIHKKAYESLKALSSSVDEQSNSLKNISIMAKNDMDSRITRWVSNEFFVKEKNLLSQCRTLEEFNKQASIILSSDSLNTQIKAKLDELSQILFNDWQEGVRENISKLNTSLSLYHTQVDNDQITDTSSKKGAALDSTVNTAVAGAAVGAGGAAILALSPYMTFMVACPPLLLTGAIAGAVLGIGSYAMKGLKNSSELKHKMALKCDEIELQVKHTMEMSIVPKMRAELYRLNQQYYDCAEANIMTVYTDYGTSEQRVKEELASLCDYIEQMEFNISNRM